MKGKTALLIVLFGVFSKQLAWSSFLPLWQTPDEQAHFAQVQNIAETNSFFQSALNTSREVWTSEILLATDRNDGGDNKYTYHPEFNIPYSSGMVGFNEAQINSFPQNYRTDYVINEGTWYPPAYYFLGSGIYKLFVAGSLFDRVFVVRFLSAISLVFLSWCAYLVGRNIFDKEREALVLAILVGFQPMLTFVHSGVTSDSLFNLLFGLFLLMGLRLLNRGLNVVDLFITGAVIILSFWTKPQANIMAFILIPLLFFMVVRKQNLNVKTVLITMGIAIASVFGLYSRLSSGASFLPETDSLKNLSLSIAAIWEHFRFTLNHTYREVLPWYWGVFRWLSLGLPNWLRQITNLLTLASFFGVAVYFARSFWSRRYDKKLTGVVFLFFSMLIYFLAITTFDFGFRQAHGFSYGIQGRYFFPVIISQMAIFLVGLTFVLPEKLKVIAVKALPVGMVLINVLVFFWVIGSYYSPSWPTFFLQASQYKPVWLKFPINLVALISYLVGSSAIIWAITTYAKKTDH